MEGKGAKLINLVSAKEEELEEAKLEKPKKPLSSYLLFLQAQKNKGNKITIKQGSELWNKLSDEEKKV
jgi:hypothetical protein